jgi:hypothetical protein
MKLINRGNWFTAFLIFLLPVTLVFFLGSQMAYGQVKAQFDTYQNIPQINSAAELDAIPAGTIVMAQGQISANTPLPVESGSSGLVVFQERPAEGRETRYGEEFSLIFPAIVLELPDGLLTVIPSEERERIIQAELHTVPDGELRRTGFKVGDTVMVQGEWQAGTAPTLVDVTGITGGDKAGLIAQWQDAFTTVSWVRNGLGALALVSLIALIVQWRRNKISDKRGEEWQNPTATIQTI